MYGGYGYYGLGYSLFDPTMILVYIGALLSLWASSKVNSTFQRYSRVRSMTGMTGAEAAKRLHEWEEKIKKNHEKNTDR